MMVKMICATVVCFGLVSWAQSQTVIRGTVKDESNAPVKAYVMLHNCEAFGPPGMVAQNWEADNSPDGGFSFKVQPGCYDLFVSGASSFLPHSERICALSDKKIVEVKVRLKKAPRAYMRLQ